VVTGAGVGERHCSAVLVGEAGQDIVLGLVRGGASEALAVALDVGEPQQPQELSGCGVGQPQGLVLEEAAGDSGAVVGLQGVDGFQPQLGGAWLLRWAPRCRVVKALGLVGWKWTESPSGSLFWRR
jgi:hypothetical protein